MSNETLVGQILAHAFYDEMEKISVSKGYVRRAMQDRLMRIASDHDRYNISPRRALKKTEDQLARMKGDADALANTARDAADKAVRGPAGKLREAELFSNRRAALRGAFTPTKGGTFDSARKERAAYGGTRRGALQRLADDYGIVLQSY